MVEKESTAVDGSSGDGGGASGDEGDDEVPSGWTGPSETESVVKGFPPVAPFIGVTPTLCYLLRDKKPLCCLQLAQVSQRDKLLTIPILKGLLFFL